MKLFTLSNYILASHAILGMYLFHAFSTNDSFYAAIQYLALQKPAVAAIYNYCFIIFIGVCELLMLLFFGRLRHLEVEQVVEQGRGFFMDAILFLVLSKPLINGKEIDTLKLIKCLCCLIALKGYHLVLFIRSQHIFQTGIPSLTTLLRNLAVMYVLTLMDLSLIFLFYSLSTNKSTFFMWLLFESIGMFQGIICCISKYLINLADIILIHGVSQKQTYLFYLDLIHDLISLLAFVGFMTIFFLLNPTTLPLYMVVDVIQVVRNLAVRISTLLKYRKLSKIIELRFPNATSEQANAQDTCIICREKLDETCKSLDCSHVFHYQCLKSWIIHQISCPLCRKEIVYRDPVETLEEMGSSENADNLLKKIVEKDTNWDPFDQFQLTQQSSTDFNININDNDNDKFKNINLNGLKEVYREIIASVDTCVDLLNKYNAIEPQSASLLSALGVISLDQFERYILLSELPNSDEIQGNSASLDGADGQVDTGTTSDPRDNSDRTSNTPYNTGSGDEERQINLPVKLFANPSRIASVLGYRMRVIDSMVGAFKELKAESI